MQGNCREQPEQTIEKGPKTMTGTINKAGLTVVGVDETDNSDLLTLPFFRSRWYR